MKRFRFYVLLLGILGLIVSAAIAVILSGERAEVVFEKGKVPEGVTWSPSFSLTEDGLVSPQPKENTSYEVWIQTQKIPAGLAWRPPTAVRITLSVRGTAPGGFPMSAYVRYGCDAVHWSTWYFMPESEKPAVGAVKSYGYDLRLPEAARESYDELMRQWWKTEPEWSSDEDAFCRWLAKTKPEFFAQEFPFVGYVQFRLENLWVREQAKFKSLSVEMSSRVSGFSSAPKSGKEPSFYEKWHFDLGGAR